MKFTVSATFTNYGEATFEAQDFDEAIEIAKGLTSGDFEFIDGTQVTYDSLAAVPNYAPEDLRAYMSHRPSCDCPPCLRVFMAMERKSLKKEAPNA